MNPILDFLLYLYLEYQEDPGEAECNKNGLRECCEPKEDKLQDHCLRGREWQGNCDQSAATLQTKSHV